MGGRVWTDEEIEWIRENYSKEHVPHLLDQFEKRFGRRPTAGALAQKAYKLGLRHSREKAPDTMTKRIVWAREPAYNAWMDEHDVGQAVPALSEQFEAEFGFPLSRGQVNVWRANNGRQMRPRRPGGGRPRKPIGYERRTKGGILVKVRKEPVVPMSKDNWEFKHYIVYREVHGSIPDGYDIVCADKNPFNCSPENLVAVPHRLMARINSVDTPDWHDAESLRQCVALCELASGIHKAELSVPRKCGVCGKTFLPDPSMGADYQNRHRKTCPECRAQGLKARGERTAKLIATCCVCGKQFAARAKNQKRCPECIAIHPKWGAKRHAHLEERKRKD